MKVEELIQRNIEWTRYTYIRLLYNSSECSLTCEEVLMYFKDYNVKWFGNAALCIFK